MGWYVKLCLAIILLGVATYLSWWLFTFIHAWACIAMMVLTIMIVIGMLGSKVKKAIEKMDTITD